MISSLRGRLTQITTNAVVVEVGGVGVLVRVPTGTLTKLHIGNEVELRTTLVVREESLTLYGFLDVDELATFETLMGIKGIGAKTALLILNVLSPDELRMAIANKDEATLMRVKGVGKQSVKRLILEIGSKLGPVVGTNTANHYPANAIDPNVVEALMNLGWKETEAMGAVNEARVLTPMADVSQLLKTALQILGKRG